MPCTGATAPEQHALTKEIPTTEETPGNSEMAGYASELVAKYEDNTGWFCSERYFKDLVQEFTGIEKLPTVDLADDYLNPSSSRKTTPLYSLAYGNLHLTPKDVMSDQGDTLSLRVSFNIIMSHLRSGIRNEMADILETHTTSREQLSRIQSLLKDIRKFKNKVEIACFYQILHSSSLTIEV